MKIRSDFSYKGLSLNNAWARFVTNHEITVERNLSFRDETSFFTIGSCFANELRYALEIRGLTVYPKIQPKIHCHFLPKKKQSFRWGEWDERVHLQFYNTFSLRQEFEKAFGLWQQDDADHFVLEDVDGTTFWDPYRRAIHTSTLDGLLDIKHALDNALRDGIHQADTLVVTLGMTETFFRTDNNRAVCQYNKHFVDRLQFKQTDFASNMDNIDAICRLYFGTYPERKMVLSVSPVALAQTFARQDVVVANAASKSTLRAVAHEISSKWPNVIYWPSYEACMWGAESFEQDMRHVTGARVASIMEAFLEAHCATTDEERASRRAADVAAAMAERHLREEQKARQALAVQADKARQREAALVAKAERIADELERRRALTDAKAHAAARRGA